MSGLSRFRCDRVLIVLCAGLMGGASWGQTTEEVTQWRQDIEAQRATAEKVFASEKLSCYQQFSVSDCLTRARQKLNAAMSEAKRQEFVINTAERKRRADLQVRKLEARESPKALQGAAEQRSQRAADAQTNQDRVVIKQRQQALTQPTGTAEARTRDYQQKEAQKAREHRAPTLINPDAVEKLSAFKQKQQEAAARQADVEKTRQERIKPLSAPLPALGSASTPLVPQLAAP